MSGGSVSLAGVTIVSNQNRLSRGQVANGHFCGGGISNVGEQTGQPTSLITNATLIGNNTSFGFPDDVFGPITCSYTLLSQTVDSVITNDGGNVFDLDPMLDPGGLKFNGGPTRTVALENGSPAINAVPIEHCTDASSPPHPLTIDQRGMPRPDNREHACDIGAYESQWTLPGMPSMETDEP